MTESFAQALIDQAVGQVNKAGFGVVADGTVHGNGIWLDSLRVRPMREIEDATNPVVDPESVDAYLAANPPAEPEGVELPLGIQADIDRLKELGRFGGDKLEYVQFCDGEEYHRTLERVVKHFLAAPPVAESPEVAVRFDDVLRIVNAHLRMTGASGDTMLRELRKLTAPIGVRELTDGV